MGKGCGGWNRNGAANCGKDAEYLDGETAAAAAAAVKRVADAWNLASKDAADADAADAADEAAEDTILVTAAAEGAIGSIREATDDEGDAKELEVAPRLDAVGEMAS